MWLGKVILLISALLFSTSFSSPNKSDTLAISHQKLPFNAKVIRIMDGDTMEVLYNNTPIKIRLAHIDSPEKRNSQPFGNNAKKALSDLCFSQNVLVYPQKYDRYKRLIAIIINSKKQTVNQEMVKVGMAWHFKKYSSDVTYAVLENNARKNRIGLWKEPNPIAPWEWRKPKAK